MKKTNSWIRVVALTLAGLGPTAAWSEEKDQAHVAGYASVGLSDSTQDGSGASVGGRLILTAPTTRKMIEKGYGSGTRLTLRPELEADVQIDAGSGDTQKAGIALSGFDLTVGKDNRVDGGDGAGFIRMLDPTLQYRRDNRIGVTELPKIDVFHTGVGSIPNENGSGCGAFLANWVVGPNALSWVQIDGHNRAVVSWDFNAGCHFSLKKTGQLYLAAGAEIGGILGSDEGGLMTRVFAGAALKNIGGSAVYANAQVSRAGYNDSELPYRRVVDATLNVGIAK